MHGIERVLASLAVGTMLFVNVPTAVIAQEGPKDDSAKTGEVKTDTAPPSSNAAATPSIGVASAEDFSELKTEMKQLRALVEQQQAQIAKLKAGGSASTEATGSDSAQAAPAPAPAPTPAPAPQAAEEASEPTIRALRIGGFGNWAYAKTGNVNEFDLANPHGRYDNIDAGLIITLGITPTINATTQISFQSADDHTETDVDFAFLDWKVNDKLSVRAGQAKNPFGLYSEFLGIGTLYPFNDVPQGIYGGTGIGSEFYRGVGVTGRAFATKKWEMNYDFFFGGILVDELGPAERISDAILNEQSVAQIEDRAEEEHQTFGGRFTFARPDNGFKFGINGNSGISSDVGRHTIVGAFAAYDTAKWLLRSEYGYQFEAGFTHHSAAYVEAGYKIDSHWQPVFRYDWARQGLILPLILPDKLFSHREVAVGLNYWVNPKAVVKFSYHHVDGNLLAVPRGEIDLSDLLFSAIPKTTNLATFGLSFIF
jgi:hypothetical protein